MTRGSERAAVVPGIDLVKPVLALLVIWIHTAPLARIAPTGERMPGAVRPASETFAGDDD